MLASHASQRGGSGPIEGPSFFRVRSGSRPLTVRRRKGAEPSWSREPRQRLTPICLRRRFVLRGEPAYVITIGPRYGNTQLPAVARGLREAEQFLHDQRQTPSVQQQVMVRPHKTIHLIVDFEDRQPHQWRHGEIEAGRSIYSQKTIEITGRIGASPPIVLCIREVRLTMHDLEWLIERLPDKRGAE